MGFFGGKSSEVDGGKMNDTNAALAASRAGVNDLLTAADKCEAVWTVPRAQRKWSPSQVVEHIALVLDESAPCVTATASSHPSLPSVFSSSSLGASSDEIFNIVRA